MFVWSVLIFLTIRGNELKQLTPCGATCQSRQQKRPNKGLTSLTITPLVTLQTLQTGSSSVWKEGLLESKFNLQPKKIRPRNFSSLEEKR